MESEKILKTQNEILWAQIFNSTIQSSAWFKDQSISPGRWAAGYPFLYALYRTLDEIHPKSILELGLGQTTRIISQYASAFKDVSHTIVEHDEAWIEFFTKKTNIPDNSEIITIPITYHSKFMTDKDVVSYIGFKKRFEGRRFDLICIDGPFGFLAKEYCRVDVLRLMPECLADDFVIFLDDAERKGERNTVRVMKRILDENDISYKTGVYSGLKDTFVLASEGRRFLCSM